MENFFLDNKDMQFYLKTLPLEEIVRLKERDYKDANEFDYAPRNFEDALINYEKSLEVMGEICAEHIAPVAADIDKEGHKLENGEVIYHPGTQLALDMIKKAGLTGITVPRRYNGLNFPTVIYTMMIELVARAEAGLMNIFSLQDIGETIYESTDDEEIKKKYVTMFANGEVTGAMILTEPEAGSDLQRVKTKAVYDEESKTWRLYGAKRFITNGNAQVSLVLARSEEGTNDARGLSMFLIERDDTVKIRRIEEKLGIHGSPTCEMQFDGTPAILIGRRKMGLIKYVMELMNGARLGISGQSLGIAEAAYREALKYAHERRQFHKSIIEFPAVYNMLVNMRVQIEAGRVLTYYTSMMVDYKKVYTEIFNETKDKDIRGKMKYYTKIANALTPMSKFYTTEMANRVAYDAIQIHGGDGYMKDYNVERHYRDARITNIYEGTTQLQVVAAIGSVVTGDIDKEYDKLCDLIKEGVWEEQRNKVSVMRKKLEELREIYKKELSEEEKSYYARSLVNIATNILISYLLLRDARLDSRKAKVAEIFIQNAELETNRDYLFVIKRDKTVIENKELIYEI